MDAAVRAIELCLNGCPHRRSGFHRNGIRVPQTLLDNYFAAHSRLTKAGNRLDNQPSSCQRVEKCHNPGLQIDLLLLFSTMIKPADSADEKNIDQQLGTGWPDLLLNFDREKLMHAMPLILANRLTARRRDVLILPHVSH